LITYIREFPLALAQQTLAVVVDLIYEQDKPLELAAVVEGEQRYVEQEEHVHLLVEQDEVLTALGVVEEEVELELHQCHHPRVHLLAERHLPSTPDLQGLGGDAVEVDVLGAEVPDCYVLVAHPPGEILGSPELALVRESVEVEQQGGSLEQGDEGQEEIPLDAVVLEFVRVAVGGHDREDAFLPDVGVEFLQDHCVRDVGHLELVQLEDLERPEVPVHDVLEHVLLDALPAPVEDAFVDIDHLLVEVFLVHLPLGVEFVLVGLVHEHVHQHGLPTPRTPEGIDPRNVFLRLVSAVLVESVDGLAQLFLVEIVWNQDLFGV